MTDGWNYQTNIKNKPNAQGTLFSGGASQIPADRRYPRGYTPERMQAVKSTVQFPERNYSRGPQRDFLNRENAAQTIARSTVPTKDLAGLTVRVLPFKGAIIGGGRGVYEDDTQTALIAQHASGDQTVVHEIGHHVSHRQSGGVSYGPGTPHDRGREEGFADRYADEHFRPDPAAKKKMLDDPRRGLSNYEPSALQTRDRNGRSRGGDFTKGYNAARPLHTRVPNSDDLARERALKSMDAYLTKQDNAPRLPGL